MMEYTPPTTMAPMPKKRIFSSQMVSTNPATSPLKAPPCARMGIATQKLMAPPSTMSRLISKPQMKPTATSMGELSTPA
jgi:hypothetical protein